MQPRNDVVEERIKRPFPASLLEQEEGRKKKKLERGGYIKERKKNIKGHPSPSTKAAEGAREVRELSQVPLVPGSAAHTSRGGAQHRNGAIAYFFYYSFLRYKIKEDAGLTNDEPVKKVGETSDQHQRAHAAPMTSLRGEHRVLRSTRHNWIGRGCVRLDIQTLRCARVLSLNIFSRLD